MNGTEAGEKGAAIQQRSDTQQNQDNSQYEART
jgi:hypothetical protein